MIPHIRPQFNWVDKKTLLIPRDGPGGYQRAITKKAAGNLDPIRSVGSAGVVERMRKNFCWTLFGALMIVRRPNGDLIVLDGGHRMEAIA